MQQSNLKAGISSGFPILVGYFPMAMAFGLLAKTTGLTFGETVAFSIFVFAGASQFMALQLLQNGIAHPEIIMTTLLLNLRHLLMSATLATRLSGQAKRWTAWIAFGVTDESFSVAATREGELDGRYLLALNFTAYAGWVSGTAAGFLVGAALPAAVQQSMGITLYAMFVALLIPEVKKTAFFGLLALAAGLLHSLLNSLKCFSTGWNIIAAILVVTLSGALVEQDQPAEEVAQ